MNLVFLLSAGFFMGVVGVVSNPSSCFAASALMVAAGFGCGVVAELGSPFLALVLFIVYLGGMLVVFVYSVAMSSDLYPKAWGNLSVGLCAVSYIMVATCVCVCGGSYLYSGGSYKLATSMGFDSGVGGICLLYSVGGWSLLILGASLLLTLLVVLELVRGIFFGVLKGAS
uniref:NADH-ubiquinone oxidoreductase chain 6 n=1 Tax=Pseudocalotes microlepis TaxID=1963763 RepID=A0A384U4R2_9SAUR|nr:NADH dehydrogenase subunit 6 [Pseudocalotes microlepis]AQU64365.1 NADH dehydrogenase subunit 6 [Pseudocalotes microlepis]QGN67008.1 NADH dehydrogenase subunit 6 [Pseudocalotes microlepis]